MKICSKTVYILSGVQLSFQNITTKYKLDHQISLGSSQNITTKHINNSNLQTSSGSIISKVNIKNLLLILFFLIFSKAFLPIKSILLLLLIAKDNPA